MFEDSFLDSFMESHIGNWTGDEDTFYCEGEDDNDYEDDSYWDGYDEVDEEDDDPPEYPGLDDQHDY